MDESKFISSCHRNSFYISLHDQDLENPRRQIVSAVHTTHVHFVIQYKQHWAAVQLSISPFNLVQFPSQTFYSSSFRYSLCCDSLSGTGLISTVQRIYDEHFHPSRWDFSPKYWYVLVFLAPPVSLLRIHSGTYEPCRLNGSAADITCAKKTEKALLDYIRNLDADASTPTQDSNIEYSTKNKRQRLNNSFERTGNDGEGENGDPPKESVIDDRDPAETDDGAAETDDGDSAERSVADGENKQGKLLTNKIRNGIKALKQIRKQAVSTETALSNTAKQSDNPQTDHAMLFELMTRSANMPVEDLIGKIWNKTNQLVKDSGNISWKYLFICSCLRILHNTKKGKDKAVAR
jgi:hypothetical protein